MGMPASPPPKSPFDGYAEEFKVLAQENLSRLTIRHQLINIAIAANAVIVGLGVGVQTTNPDAVKALAVLGLRLFDILALGPIISVALQIIVLRQVLRTALISRYFTHSLGPRMARSIVSAGRDDSLFYWWTLPDHVLGSRAVKVEKLISLAENNVPLVLGLFAFGVYWWAASQPPDPNVAQPVRRLGEFLVPVSVAALAIGFLASAAIQYVALTLYRPPRVNHSQEGRAPSADR
jgi:hypothetical protein